MSTPTGALTLTDRLAIEQQLTALSYAFAYNIDHGDFTALVDLFTEDGVFHSGGQVVRGQAELRVAMQARPNTTLRHVMTNFHFTNLTADEAVGVVYCITHHANGDWDGSGPLVYGTTQGRFIDLRDRYRRTDDGWRFAERIAVPVFQPEVWP
jgi:ketosteroid isomerase-like protein